MVVLFGYRHLVIENLGSGVRLLRFLTPELYLLAKLNLIKKFSYVSTMVLAGKKVYTQIIN